MFSLTEGQRVRFSVDRLSVIMLIGLSILLIRFDANAESGSGDESQDAYPRLADLVNASTEVNWPTGFSPKTADLYAHAEITVHASLPTVWHCLIAAEQWPAWFNYSHDVRVSNDKHVLGPGSKFTWNWRFPTSTVTVRIEGTITEWIPQKRLIWLSEGTLPNDINWRDKIFFRAYHVWILIPVADGCKVVSEKTVNGEGASRAIAFERQALQDWLYALKKSSESATKISVSSPERSNKSGT